MKYRPVLIGALGLCLAVSGTLQAQHASPMYEIAEQWQNHFNSEDYEAVAALYTADAVRFPPGAPPVSGHEAIVAFLQSTADGSVVIQFGGSEMAWDMLSSWGTYEIYSASAEVEGPVQSGPWMNVAREGEDGTWKITHDIWNIRQQP